MQRRPSPSNEELRAIAATATDSSLRPFELSFSLSLLYVALCGTYIVLSGRIAAGLAESVGDLERVEMAKGLIFVFGTGALFFVAAWGVLRRIARQELHVIEQKNALLEFERRAMVGLFAASIAHDISSILVVARGNLRSMEDEHRNEQEKAEATISMRRSLEELKVLTRRLVSIEHERISNDAGEIALDQLVREGIALARSHQDVRGCKLRVTTNDPVTIHGNGSMLKMLLLNLILNAADVTNGRGRIDVRLRRTDTTAILEVHDDGPGVPVDGRRAIFDSFHSSKPHGTGLGLLTVKVAAEDHGGTVEVTDSDLGGAAFRVTLPRERNPGLEALE